MAHAGIWLLGAAGFIGPLVLARTSPHAELLRDFALTWFILFGAVNAIFVMRVFPAKRDRPDR